jgi:hypothetical protein
MEEMDYDWSWELLSYAGIDFEKQTDEERLVNKIKRKIN